MVGGEAARTRTSTRRDSIDRATIELLRQCTAVGTSNRRTECCTGGVPLIDRLPASHLKVSIMGTARRQSDDLPASIDGFARFRIDVRRCRLLDNTGGSRHACGGIVQASEGASREAPCAIPSSERTESRHGGRVVEVPLALGDTDEIANCRIGGPGAAQRSTGQFRGYASFEKLPDIAVGNDRFYWGQACRIESSGRRNIGTR